MILTVIMKHGERGLLQGSCGEMAMYVLSVLAQNNACWPIAPPKYSSASVLNKQQQGVSIMYQKNYARIKRFLNTVSLFLTQ